MTYDSIIIGCGPAGMTAAIYLARANKKVLILEKEGVGGQIASSPLVENYPGYESISGSELSNNIFEQMMKLNVDFELEKVLEIKPNLVITEDNQYKTKTIIIATGAKYRLLNLENEDNLIGNGIHFCVSCDGAFYKNKTVAVIGGGNSAVINAISLSLICNKVYLVQNLEFLTCEETLKDRIKEKNNVEILYNFKVTKLIGEDELDSIEITQNDNKKVLNIDGMFTSIGLIPEVDIINGLIEIDSNNYINSIDCNTNIESIFVAGDCRSKKIRQVTTAVSDGTIAAINAINYLNK